MYFFQNQVRVIFGPNPPTTFGDTSGGVQINMPTFVTSICYMLAGLWQL